MSFSRIIAFLTLGVFFTLISVAAIWGAQSIGTQITHGDKVAHKHGIILSREANNSLMFKTDSGQVIHFTCSERCLTEIEHIQRHIYEHAPTDVYYKSDNGIFTAVDVD